MQYFKIRPSLVAKEIGVYPQSETADYKTSIKHPAHLYTQSLNTKLGNDVVIPDPILRKKAKKTDLISCVSIIIREVISDRLKRILQTYERGELEFRPMHVIYKDEKLPYWLMNPLVYDMDFIDYERSTIHLRGGGGTFVAEEPFDSYEAYTQRKQKLQLPVHLLIKNVVLSKRMVSKELFLLTGVDGGVGYYVSPKIKNEIEAAGCTGICFEAVELI